jgi:hypothetical protein
MFCCSLARADNWESEALRNLRREKRRCLGDCSCIGGPSSRSTRSLRFTAALSSDCRTPTLFVVPDAASATAVSSTRSEVSCWAGVVTFAGASTTSDADFCGIGGCSRSTGRSTSLAISLRRRNSGMAGLLKGPNSRPLAASFHARGYEDIECSKSSRFDVRSEIPSVRGCTGARRDMRWPQGLPWQSTLRPSA